MAYLGWDLRVYATKLCDDLNQFAPVIYRGELRWYAGCRFSRDWDTGTLTIYHSGSSLRVP